MVEAVDVIGAVRNMLGKSDVKESGLLVDATDVPKKILLVLVSDSAVSDIMVFSSLLITRIVVVIFVTITAEGELDEIVRCSEPTIELGP